MIIEMSKKRLFINLCSNIISFLVTLGINFFITPIIVSKVGNDAYGFVGLANNFISYASIFTIIVNSMASRFITYEITNNNIKEANKYYSTVYYMNIILSLFIIIMSITLISNLTHIIDIPKHLISDVKITFILSFINLILSLFTSIYNIASFAKNRLDLSAIRTIVGNIIKTILLIVMFFQFNTKIFFVIIATIVMNIYLLLSNYKLSKKIAPELSIKKTNFSNNKLKVLAKAGIWNSINSLSRILLTGMDLLIANIYISADSMGILSIAKTIPTSIENLLVVFANTFNPEFVLLYSKNKIIELKNHVVFSLKIVGFSMLVPMACFVVLGTDFYSLWLPEKNLADIQQIQILSILSIAPFFVSISNYTLFVLDSVTNKLKRPVIATMIMSILSITTTLILLKTTNLGVYAIAGVSSFFWILKVFFFNTINAAKNLHLKWNTFFNPFLTNLLSFGVILFVFCIIKKYVNINSWAELLVMIVIMALIGYFISFIIIWNKEERLKVQDTIIKKVTKFTSKKKF